MRGQRESKCLAHGARRMGAIVILAAAVFLVGCDEKPVGPSAEEVGTRFYEALKRGDFAAAAALYVDKMPREQIIAELKENRSQLGDLQQYNLKDVVTNTVFSGRRYILKYKTRYTNQHATEGLILFQPVSDNVIRIEAHNVRTRGTRGP